MSDQTNEQTVELEASELPPVELPQVEEENAQGVELQKEQEETCDQQEQSEDHIGEENFALEQDFYDEKLQEEKIWQARTGLNHDTLCGAIETIIFMSDKPVPLLKIRKLLDEDMPLRVIHESLERLMKRYEESVHGIRLQEVAEGYQFRTKATYSKYVQDLFKVSALVLSPSALEVLSIVAYKQPISRLGVDNVRGVDSSHIVRALMDKRLVKAVGRTEEPGRPIAYGTTSEFLEVFNLASTEDLPPESELEEMLNTNSVGEISDIKTLVQSGDKKKFSFDEMAELDQLSESIKSIASETTFTSALKDEKKADESERKSAFDLLEEYLHKQQVEAENLESSQSQPSVYGDEPKVIADLLAGPFNVPEDEEDFEMLDLDSGDIIEEARAPKEDLLFQEEDKEKIEAALEEAFSAFEERDSLDLEEVDPEEAHLSDIEGEIEEIEKQATEMAKDLDLDLSFMEANSEILKDLDKEQQ